MPEEEVELPPPAPRNKNSRGRGRKSGEFVTRSKVVNIVAFFVMTTVIGHIPISASGIGIFFANKLKLSYYAKFLSVAEIYYVKAVFLIEASLKSHTSPVIIDFFQTIQAFVTCLCVTEFYC